MIWLVIYYMKCRECNACFKGWFDFDPDEYVCIGGLEPFVINDINHECTEYEHLKDNKKMPTEDLLIIGFDNAPNGDQAALSIMRIRDNKIEVVNMFYGKDVYEMYKHLTNW